MRVFLRKRAALEHRLRACYRCSFGAAESKVSWPALRELQESGSGPPLAPAARGRASRRSAIAALPAAVAVTALATGAVVVASGFLNLGKPTASVPGNAYFPLSGFHRAARGFPTLRSHGLPVLLWIGTAWPGDAASDAERWPVVKALLQFGTFSGISGARPGCGKTFTIGTRTGPLAITPCSLPTLDWSSARYRSRYVAFVHRDLIDGRSRLYQRLNSAEEIVFNRYVRAAGGSAAIEIGQSIVGTLGATRPGHQFPLVAIGGYLETVTQIPFTGDLAPPNSMELGSAALSRGVLPAIYFDQPLSSSQVQNSLATGRTVSVSGPPGYPPTTYPSLVPDVNAEANVITALICHADGGKPGSVCRRSAIKQLLKHVR